MLLLLRTVSGVVLLMSTRWCYCYTNSSALFHLRPYCCLNLSRVLHLLSIVGLYFQLKQHLLIDSKQKKRIKIDAEVSRPFFFFVKTLKPVVYVNQSVLLVQMQGVL